MLTVIGKSRKARQACKGKKIGSSKVQQLRKRKEVEKVSREGGKYILASKLNT